MHYLIPNHLDGYRIRQSDLSSWSRCNLQKFYTDRARSDPDAPQPLVLSRTMMGTVIHYSLMVMERLHHEGRDDAGSVAERTFLHYWHPKNIHLIEGGAQVDEWLPKDTWSGMKGRGVEIIRNYYESLKKDPSRLLALEYQFAVPIIADGRTHTLTGTVDRVALRTYYGKPYLSLDDFKTGYNKPRYPRYNIQGTVYSYASSRGEFWFGWPEAGMDLEVFDWETVDALEQALKPWSYRLFDEDDPVSHAGTHLMARKFRWLDLQKAVVTDCGWRFERDYVRLRMAIEAYVKANEAGIYMPTMNGDICRFCDFRTICGGVGLPEEKEGGPV